MRGWRLLLATGLLALAVTGAWRAAAGSPPSLDERVTAVASGLRCPACEGQSVAASESDLARQMRSVARQQLAQGRTPGQVRAWFAERYGDGVLLDPPARGAGLVALAVPVLALALGVGVLVRFVRGPGLRVPGLAAAGALAAGGLAVAVLTPALGTAGAAGSAASAAVLTPPATASPAASSPAAGPAPASSAATVRDALDALKAGRPGDAEREAQALLADDATPAAGRIDALLVLGLAQRALGDQAAAVTLRTFLDQAPDHPAAAQVRSLLGLPAAPPSPSPSR